MYKTQTCKFCEASGFKQIKTHERQCRKNPDRTSATGHIGKNHYMNGSKFLDSTRQKISESGKQRTQTEETKRKISEARLKFLDENPNKIPYKLNHSSKISYPEKYFLECFRGLGIVSEHSVSRYSLDFANLEKKVYFEVDGEQHYVDQKIVESDKRREKFLADLGWSMIRCRWADFKKLDVEQREIFVADVIRKMT